jgi:hypothetical protein
LQRTIIGALLTCTIRRRRGCLAFAAGFAAAALSANVAHAEKGTAVLIGTVTDASTKKPVADAVVTVTSPSLQGEQVTVTDSTGFYRIPDLPPGSYVLRLEKETFKPYSVPEIALHADTTIRLNAAILPEALKSEEVVVVGKAPTVDVGSSTVGATVTSEFTSRVPVSPPGGKGSANMSFESVGNVVPGARGDTYGMSFTGTTSPENQYLLDGISVGDPGFGVIGTPLSMNFIKEVSVIGGGFMPEYGRSTGGVLNAITKSGSNEFHGSVWTNFAPGGLAGTPKPVHAAGQTIETSNKLDFMGDIGGDIGGPIIQDKLWFYAGFDWAREQYKIGRSLNQTRLDSMGNPIPDGFGGNLTDPIPGTQQDYLARADLYQLIGKITWQPAKAHRIEVSGYATPYSSGGNGKFGIDPWTGNPEISTNNQLTSTTQPFWGTYQTLGHRLLGSSGNVLAKWQAQLDGDKTRLDTTLGWHTQRGGRLASDGSQIGTANGYSGISNVQWLRDSPFHSITDFETVPAGYCTMPGQCPVTEYHSGGPEFLFDQTLNSYQAHTVLTHLAEGLGHHVIKAGIELDYSTFDDIKAYAGSRDFVETNDGTLFYDGREFGYLSGPDQAVVLPSMKLQTKSLIMGGFLQDSWSIMDLVTLNVGLRYDVQNLYSGDGQLAMTLPNQWSPRIGAVYDPTREGRSKIFANYARYYQSIPLDMMDREGSGEPMIQTGYDATMCNPGVVSQQKGACQNAHIPGWGGAPNSTYFAYAQGKAPVDPDIKAPSTDEFVAGGEYEIIHNGRLGAAYTRRWINNALEDMSRDEAATFFYGNPGEGIAKDFPKAQRNYDAVTVYFNKFFSDDWLAQVSYTASYLRGNYQGLFVNQTSQLDPNMTQQFDLRDLTTNAYGPLPDDHTHSIRVFGAKDWIIPGSGDITSGLAFRAESGAPTSFLGAHPLYGTDAVYILPQGSGERLPWTYSVDLKLAYGIHMTKSESITLTADVFNLFNFQSAIARDQTYTNTAVTPVTSGGLANLQQAGGAGPFDPAQKNPNFGNPSVYQAPRIFRFGLKATF